METVTGLFRSRRAAEGAVNGLRAIGLSEDAITFITPENSGEQLASVPTTDAEAPGIGKTLSGYLGGVIGGGAGLGLGSAIASLLVPGVGTVFAAGVGAAALLGIGGAAVGSAIGAESERELDDGVPRDDVLFYRELLKQRMSVVIASTDNLETAAAARAVLNQHGAEDVDVARKQWESSRSGHAA